LKYLSFARAGDWYDISGVARRQWLVAATTGKPISQSAEEYMLVESTEKGK
jgi:hypothetical protein